MEVNKMTQCAMCGVWDEEVEVNYVATLEKKLRVVCERCYNFLEGDDE